MPETLSPYLSASLIAIVVAVLGTFAFLRKRRARVVVEILSHKFALPTPCAESLQSYKIGSVLMSLPETPEGRALESVSGADHYSQIKLTNGTRETLQDCLLKPSFSPLGVQIRRRDNVAYLEPTMEAIALGAIGPRESVHVEMWHVGGLYRKTVRKSIGIYAKQDMPKTYSIFLDTDVGAYYVWRLSRSRVLMLLLFIVICGVVLAVYWVSVILG
jgi:hypothetical protein